MWFYIVIEALFWVFAIMGFVELLQKISNHFYLYGKNGPQDITVIVTLKKREEKIEYILRSLVANLEGMSTARGQPDIYVVDAGTDNETFDIVANLCEDYDNIILCKAPQALKSLSLKLNPCDIIKDKQEIQ